MDFLIFLLDIMITLLKKILDLENKILYPGIEATPILIEISSILKIRKSRFFRPRILFSYFALYNINERKHVPTSCKDFQ